MSKKKKLAKPRDFKMPRSRYVTAVAAQESDRWFQLYSSGSMESKTARKLASWLLRTADWMDQKRKSNALRANTGDDK